MAKAPYLFMTAGGHLVPFGAYTEERVLRFRDGSVVRCPNITQPRSIPFHNGYWATLSQIVKATECAPTADHLHDSLVKACGYTSAILDVNGRVVDVVRDSTSWETMGEQEFQEYVEAAKRFLAERLGIVWDDFTKRPTPQWEAA